MAMDTAQRDAYLEQQEQLGINFDNAMQGAYDTITGIPNAVVDVANDAGKAIGDAANSAGKAIGDAANSAGDAILGNMYAQAMSDYAYAEASTLPMYQLWANMGVQQDIVENMQSGGQFARDGHSYYLDRMEQVEGIESRVEQAQEQAEIARTEGMSGLKNHSSEAEKETTDTPTGDNGSSQPDVEKSAPDVADGSKNLIAGMQNFFRSGLVAGTIPGTDGVSTEALDKAFGDVGSKMIDSVTATSEEIREAVKKENLTEVTKQAEVEMGA